MKLFAIPVHLIIVLGYLGVTEQQGIYLTRNAIARINSEVPQAKLRLRKIVVIDSAHYEWGIVQPTDSERARQRDMATLFADVVLPKRGLRVILTPPLVGPYIGGWSNTKCFKKRLRRPAAVINGSMGYLGKDRALHTETSIIHELGHLLGAGHWSYSTDPGFAPSVMDEAALRWVDKYGPQMQFGYTMTRQINNCLRQ